MKSQNWLRAEIILDNQKLHMFQTLIIKPMWFPDVQYGGNRDMLWYTNLYSNECLL